MGYRVNPFQEPRLRDCVHCGRMYGDEYEGLFCLGCSKPLLTPFKPRLVVPSRFRRLTKEERDRISIERARLRAAERQRDVAKGVA